MRRRLLPFVLLGLVVTAVTALGITARATHGAQTTADEPQYLLSAISVFEDGDLDISDELAAERYRQFHEVDLPQQTEPLADGRRVSPHDPLLPLLLAVPVGLGGWVGAKAALAVTAGMLAALIAWTAHRRLGVGLGVSVTVAAVGALAPPLAVYATQVYPEIVAATVVTAAVAGLAGSGGRARWVTAVAVVALPWLAVKYVPVAGALALALLVRSDRSHRRRFTAWFVGTAAAYVAGHLLVYGGLTPYAAGDHFVSGEFTAVGSDVDLWGRSVRLIGLLVDGGFGLAAWQPLYLLLPLTAGWLWARHTEHSRMMIGVLGAGWLTASFVALTMHGWWFPGRQVVVVLPVALLMVAMWADEHRLRSAVVVAAGAAGVAAFSILVVAGASGDITWVVDFAATSDPLRRAAAVVFPDYMAPSARTWILHGTWVVLAVGLAVAGWVTGRNRSRPASSEIRRISSEHQREKVMT